MELVNDGLRGKLEGFCGGEGSFQEGWGGKREGLRGNVEGLGEA